MGADHPSIWIIAHDVLSCMLNTSLLKKVSLGSYRYDHYLHPVPLMPVVKGRFHLVQPRRGNIVNRSAGCYSGQRKAKYNVQKHGTHSYLAHGSHSWYLQCVVGSCHLFE